MKTAGHVQLWLTDNASVRIQIITVFVPIRTVAPFFLHVFCFYGR